MAEVVGAVQAWSRGDGCDRCGGPVDLVGPTHCPACRDLYRQAFGGFHDAMERLCAEVGMPYERPRFVRTAEGGWR